MASSRVFNSRLAHSLTAGSQPPSTINAEDPEEESIRLAIALQLEDLENSYERDVDKGNEAAVFEVYRNYLEESERFLADRRLAEELAAGPEPFDGMLETVLEHVLEPKGGPDLMLEPGEEDDDFDEDSDLDEQVKLACQLSLKLFEDEKRRNEKPSSSTAETRTAGTRTVPETRTVPVPRTIRDCTGCMESFAGSELITPPCSHPYCVTCLKQFFTNAVEDQSAFPPRCCKLPIPLYLIYRRLSKQEVKLFREKVAEYTAKDRLYCSHRSCSAFIPCPTSSSKSGGSSHPGEVVTCKACKRGTCTRCKAPEHAGDCPEDNELKDILSTALREGWQRCGGCHALVEKAYGCQHMSCRCGSEWCYRCAAKWKSCGCSDFEDEGAALPPRTVDDLLVKKEDEAVLRRRREERERQRRQAWARCNHGGPLSAKLRGRAKAREKGQQGTRKGKERAEGEDGREDKVMEDETLWGEEGMWKYKLGESRCDMCEVVLKDYIWACDGCGLEACMACRENGM